MTKTVSKIIKRSKSEMDLYRLDEAHRIFTIEDDTYAEFRFYFENTDTVEWLTIHFI